MIDRLAQVKIAKLLNQFPVVAILGPRQVGKTTMAFKLAENYTSIYLDLENEADLAKLTSPLEFFQLHQDKLVVLDEVQRRPELFQVLRGVVDDRIRKGKKFGQFLMLGSASLDLLRQSGESLAGRIAYIEMSGFNVLEYPNTQELWLRGGFADSVLADSDEASFTWRRNFIKTYLERDVPMFGSRVSAETLRRFWTMLCHLQGTTLNAAKIASALGVDNKTVVNYLDLMVDLLLVRRLEPLHKNIKKRLIKSPKIYVRDSGLVHNLLGIVDMDQLLSNPIAGMTWEGMVVENVIAVLETKQVSISFYRSSSGNEIDLVLEPLNGELIGVEIKRGLTPKVSRGLRQAISDLEIKHTYIVYSGEDRFPLEKGIEVISLEKLLNEIR